MKPTQTLILSLAYLIAGCATPTGARPDDMSAAKHRQQAAKERREAKEHGAKHDPGKDQPFAAPGGPAGGVGLEWGDGIYNPTDAHHNHVRKHERHAKAHLKAAQALERYEQAQCRKFSNKVRPVCPLMGQVVRVERLANGARLHVAKKVRIEAMLDHMRCHYAFGRKMGRAGMSQCPLYLKHLSLKKVAEGHAVEITTKDPATVTEIQHRSEVHVVAPASKHHK